MLYTSRNLLAGFILAIATISGLGVYTYLTIVGLIRNSRQLNQTNRVIAVSNQLLAHAIEMETVQLGFVITANDYYLESYYNLKYALFRIVEDLEGIVTADQSRTTGMDTLQFLLKEKMSWTDNVIEARKVSRDSANQLVSSGIGKNILLQIKHIIKAIQQDSKVIPYNTFNKEKLVAFQVAFLGLLIVTGLTITILFYTVNHIMKKHLKSEKFLSNALRDIHVLYDNAPCGYLSVDSDIRITNINQTLLNWLGYSVDEIVGKLKYEDLLTDESKTHFLESFEKDFEEYKIKGYVHGLEFEFKRKDGTKFPVLVNSAALFDQQGNFYKSTTTVFDISDRKKLEARLASFIDSSPDALIIADQNGNIQMVNNQSEAIFGFTRHEMIGQKVEMLVPGDLRVIHTNHRMAFVKHPTKRPMGAGIELNAFRKDGRMVPVEISLSPIQTGDGMFIIAAIRDITERKEKENKIKQLNAELEAFTYSVSHDLRAPLRSIHSFATILKQDFASNLDNEGIRILDTVIRNAQRMGQLIDDLLNLSRTGRQELRVSEVNMNQLVRGIADELISHENARKIELTIDELINAKADLTMIGQVWINLISNALKYTSKKEVAIIKIACKELEEEIHYSVSDNGAGFDERYSNKLFEVFQRLHSLQEFEGTGVGLALTKRIIKRHGGLIWASGQVDAGATFTFSLPK